MLVGLIKKGLIKVMSEKNVKVLTEAATMREFFFRRFGAGQPKLAKERERIYLLGMPGPTDEVFPPRCNMEEKLDSLETERDFLLDMCPKEKHDTYDPGKETTLVRFSRPRSLRNMTKRKRQ